MTDMVTIPGRDAVALLRAEARKKPAIAALIDAAQTMTDAEIDTMKVPLPWYRKALKKMRDMRISSETTARLSEIIANSVQEVFLNDIGYGAMRRWNGNTTFINVTRGALEVKTGDLVWFPEDGGVWIDTVFAEKIDPQLADSTHLGRVKRSDYIEACRQRRCGNAPQHVPHTVVYGESTQTMSDDRGLFRIQRH